MRLGAFTPPFPMIEFSAIATRTWLRSVAALFAVSAASASPTLTPRNLLAGEPELHQLGRDIPGIQAALLPYDEWEPFPRASDRAGWEVLGPDIRARLIAAGEAALATPWPRLPATLYLDYMRNGDRRSYQVPWTDRRTLLRDLVLAECAEGDGRFLDAITDSIWSICEETSWVYPAHIFMQRAGSDLPDTREQVVDLGTGETAALITWTDYLLGAELDAISPVIRTRIAHEIEERILEPCLNRADFWWMAWDTQGHPINNWNPWIVANWISSALLIEKDPELRARHIEKAQRVLDIFINSYPADGGCDEGPSYWGRAGASMFEALAWMQGASEGRISIFDEPLIAKMGRYILTAHIGNGWYKNFADANARTFVDGALTYRYGKAVGDDELAAFGAYLWQQQQDGPPPNLGSIGRILPDLFLAEELSRVEANDPLPRDGWLPDLQIMTARDAAGTTDGLYVTAKGGHNDESHNHNDVGSFIAYLDGLPLIIDVGPEIYTAKTFSDQRYEIWTMRSSWHNVPLINGVEQAPGRSFAARDVTYAADAEYARFGLELAHTYPPEAAVESWQRSITLERDEQLEIRDAYQLREVVGPTAQHLITNRPITVNDSGTVSLGAFPGEPTSRGALLKFDPTQLNVRITSIEVTDSRLLGVWGERVSRIEFVTESDERAGTIAISIQPANRP